MSQVQLQLQLIDVLSLILVNSKWIVRMQVE